MKFRRFVALSTFTALLAVAGCATENTTSSAPTPTQATEYFQDAPPADVPGDCDLGDQREHDEDCGYYNDAGVFVYYPWVVQGSSSKPPSGWDKNKYHQDNKVTDNRTKYHTTPPVTRTNPTNATPNRPAATTPRNNNNNATPPRNNNNATPPRNNNPAPPRNNPAPPPRRK